jgi:hypothetical protein
MTPEYNLVKSYMQKYKFKNPWTHLRIINEPTKTQYWFMGYGYTILLEKTFLRYTIKGTLAPFEQMPRITGEVPVGD